MSNDENSEEFLPPVAETLERVRGCSGDDDSADEPVSISRPPPVARVLPAGLDDLSQNSIRSASLTAEYRCSPDATETGEIYVGDRTPQDARVLGVVTIGESYSGSYANGTVVGDTNPYGGPVARQLVDTLVAYIADLAARDEISMDPLVDEDGVILLDQQYQPDGSLALLLPEPDVIYLTRRICGPDDLDGEITPSS